MGTKNFPSTPLFTITISVSLVYMKCWICKKESKSCQTNFLLTEIDLIRINALLLLDIYALNLEARKCPVENRQNFWTERNV